MWVGLHPISTGITVCVLLLCNCIPLRATPERFSRWPILQIFGESAAATISNEIRRSSMSASSPHHTSSSHSSSSSSSTINHSCSGCLSRKSVVPDHDDESSSIMSAAEKEYRIEAVKRQILTALNLVNPPVPKGPFPTLTSDIVEKIVMEEEKTGNDEDDLEAEYDSFHTTKKLVLGVAGAAEGNGESRVKLSFVISPEIQHATLVRGKLWLSVLNSPSANKRSLLVRQRFRYRYHVTQVVGVHRLTDAEEWVGIDLSPAWSANEHIVHFDVITDSPQQIINISASPILEVHVKTHGRGDARRRVRRGVNCESNNSRTCCLQSFSVHGRDDLGWEWLVYPSTLEVNYCRGSCEAGTEHIYNHSSVIYTRSMAESNARLRAQMMPCCTPKRLGNLQLLYFIDESNVQTKLMPNLKVLECGCA